MTVVVTGAPVGPQLAEGERVLYKVNVDEETGQRMVSLFLHEGQARCLYSPARFTAMVAGSQSGKTSFSPWWLWSRIRGLSVPELGVDIKPMGGGTYLAVGPTFDLTSLRLVPCLIEAFVTALDIGRWFSGPRIMELKEPPKLEDGTYDWDNWSDGAFTGTSASSPMWGQIIVRSAESKGGLESSTARAAILDECGMPSFEREAWEAVLRRLSISRGPILLTTTPYFYGGWLKTEILDRAEAQDPNVRLVRVPSLVNPAFSREEFEERRARMNPERFAMMYLGIPTRMSGLIYPDFESAAMRVPRGRILKMDGYSWSFTGGIDWGWHNPFAAVLLARSPTGAVYLLRTYKKSETLLEEHARVLLSWIDDLPPNATIQWCADPSGKTEMETMKAMGFWITPGVNTPAAILAGVDGVTALMRTGRFWLYGQHKSMVEELENYTWEQGKDEVLLDKPRKVADHLCDALRYATLGMQQYTELASGTRDTGKSADLHGARKHPRERALAQTSRGDTRTTEDLKRRLLRR